MNPKDFDAFVQGYVYSLCADLLDETGGYVPCDKVSSETLREMKNDCAEFIRRVEEAGIEFENSPQTAGHDFALTRNGHGSGYWDGDYPLNGEELSEIATSMGETFVYWGDDGQVWT